MTSTFAQRQVAIVQMTEQLKTYYLQAAQITNNLSLLAAAITALPKTLSATLSDISSAAATGTIAYQQQADAAANLLNELAAVGTTIAAIQQAIAGVVPTPPVMTTTQAAQP
jgi:hypothetical protein